MTPTPNPKVKPAGVNTLAVPLPELGGETALAGWLERLREHFHVDAAVLEPADKEVFPALWTGIPGSRHSHLPFLIHANSGREPLIVPDARQDERFQNARPVMGYPGVRFYAGFPLYERGSELPLGSLSLIDSSPRSLSPANLAAMRSHAEALMDWIEQPTGGNADERASGHAALPTGRNEDFSCGETTGNRAGVARAIPKDESPPPPAPDTVAPSHSKHRFHLKSPEPDTPKDASREDELPQAKPPVATPPAGRARPIEAADDGELASRFHPPPSMVANWIESGGENGDFLKELLEEFKESVPPKIEFLRMLAERGDFRGATAVGRLILQYVSNFEFEALAALVQSALTSADEKDGKSILKLLEYWDSAFEVEVGRLERRIASAG